MTLTGSSALDQSLAGFLAGACSTSLLHPLDLIKVRLQVNASPSTHLLPALRSISSQFGFQALYRGLSANLAGSTLSWGIYFGIYEVLKKSMRERSGQDRLSARHHLLASAEAGALTSLCTNPLWVIKTRMCTQNINHPNAYRSLPDGLVKLWRGEGLRGLYKGFIPALFGVSHGALQFMAYEEMKKLWQEFQHPPSSSTTLSINPQRNPNPNKDLGTVTYLIMAASSKVFATVCTYPYQVVRSRIQIQTSSKDYAGVWKTMALVYRFEGVLGFYKGLGVNIIRVLPGTCITFGVYEGLSSFFRSL